MTNRCGKESAVSYAASSEELYACVGVTMCHWYVSTNRQSESGQEIKVAEMSYVGEGTSKQIERIQIILFL